MNDSKFPLYPDCKTEKNFSSAFMGRLFKTPSDVVEAVFQHCKDLKIDLTFIGFEKNCLEVAREYGVSGLDRMEMIAYHQDLKEELK
jgi:hypothetical protein